MDPEEESRMTPELAGGASIQILLFNEQQWRVLLLGASQRRPCLIETKKPTKFYFDKVRFVILELGAQESATDTNSGVVSV